MSKKLGREINNDCEYSPDNNVSIIDQQVEKFDYNFFDLDVESSLAAFQEACGVSSRSCKKAQMCEQDAMKLFGLIFKNDASDIQLDRPSQL